MMMMNDTIRLRIGPINVYIHLIIIGLLIAPLHWLIDFQHLQIVVLRRALMILFWWLCF